MTNDDEKKKKQSSLENISIAAGTHSHSQLHSEASSQLIQAYNGVRYDSKGSDLGHKGRSLKGISDSKVNPDYADNNIKQQAGFSAELLTEAKANKQAILDGNSDRMRTADGLGRTKDQVNDLYMTDADGNIKDTGHSQSKFLSSTKNPDESYKKIVNEYTSNPKYEKYMESEISVPSDQYEQAKIFAEEERLRFLQQAEKAKTPEAREKLLTKAEKAERLRDSLKDSGVTSQEAIESRLNPKLYVAKETVKDIHNSSANIAQSAMIVSGVISTGRNLYNAIQNDTPMEEVVENIAKDIVVTGGKAYAINATSMSTALVLKNSKKEVLRRLGSTAAPTAIATATFEIASSISRYAKGDIDMEELLVELGEKGAGAVAASYGAAVGSLILPGIGTIAGGMIGHTLSSILYNSSLKILQDAKIAKERRIEIERISEQAIIEMKRYRENLAEIAIEHKSNRNSLFNNFFDNLTDFEQTQDVNKLFVSIDKISDYFGIETEFKSFDEFDDFMNDDDSVLVL